MSRIRLLIATPLYPPDLGGPATYTKLLEEGIERYGFDTPIIVKFGDVRTYPRIIRHWMYFVHVFRAAKHVDVVLALDPVSVGVPALMAARLRRKPFVVKIVGDYAWEQGVQRFGITDSLDVFVRKGRVPFGVALLRAVQTHVAKSAKRVLVPSSYLKGIISAWGVLPSKITVIYNAIELEEGGTIPEEVRRAASPKIVTIGRLVPWKRVEGIIDAVAALPGEASLIIVGEGAERPMLEAHAQRKLPGRTIFTGPRSHADTLAILADADMFVLNSTYEGLSHVLIEALMQGTVVIATDAGGNGELITHEENGLLIPVGGRRGGGEDMEDSGALTHALERVIADPVFADGLRVRARDAKTRFSAGTMRERTADFLKEIVDTQ